MMNNTSLFLEFLNTLDPLFTGMCYKVQISLKITDLDSPFKLLRLVRFESL